jgi:3alpha(or 20beta)-hydroxysteroid dehydrogenase
MESPILGTFSPNALEGHVILVSGAGGGIGAAVATRLAEAGADLVITDLRPDELAATEQAINELYRRPATSIIVDLSEITAGDQAVGAAVQAHGRLDGLVHCAALGYHVRGTVDSMPPSDWDLQMAIDLRSVYLVGGAAVRQMRLNGGGSIVNIASSSAFVHAFPGNHSYSAAKAAVVGLTQAMSVNYGRDQIRVNSVAPGITETPILATLDERTRRRSLSGVGIPLGRIGHPDDIAATCLFLLSDSAAYITGMSILVDGGGLHFKGYPMSILPGDEGVLPA